MDNEFVSAAMRYITKDRDSLVGRAEVHKSSCGDVAGSEVVHALQYEHIEADQSYH